MTEQWMPGNKKELISAIEKEWKLLLQVVEKLSDKQIQTPDAGGWSPKDNLAHLTEWMNILMGYHMDKRPAHEVIGVSQDQLTSWQIEVINPILLERNRNRSREDVMADMQNTYKQLLTKLEATPFEDLLKPRHTDDPEKRPLLLWVLGDSNEHFLEHRETIERGMKAK